jgi:uncharacterized protein YutE (UPF0331/DUF86 family)
VRTEVVIQRLRSLQEYALRLRAYQALSEERLVTDHTSYWAVQRGLQVAIQHVTDIGAHLLAGMGMGTASDYRDIILDLGRHSILPLEFARRISGMAGFRNILVHQYLDLDPGEVYRNLQMGPDDFEAFVDYVLAFLQQGGYMPSGEDGGHAD